MAHTTGRACPIVDLCLCVVIRGDAAIAGYVCPRHGQSAGSRCVPRLSI